MSNTTNYAHGEPGPSGIIANDGQPARGQALRQIERRRRFRVSCVVASMGMALLVAIWATAEYHNAGGWPTEGFGQSSGTHDVWNIWIIYPLIAWAFGTAAHAWLVYRHKPVTESEIIREMERQASVHQGTGGFTQ
jgi:hypothetical protein